MSRKEKANAVVIAAAGLLDALEDGRPEEEIQQKFEALQAAFEDLALLFSGDGDKTEFSKFLASVSNSVVDAQQDLDDKSREYLEISQKWEHVLPSVFRLPKVTADVKFAFEKVDGKTVNLIFFKSTTQRKELHQQSMHFEIVSAPPPPELLAKLKSGSPAIALALSRNERASVFAAVREAPVSGPAISAVQKDVLLEAKADRVIIWRAAEAGRYFLLHAGTEEDEVGVWHLALDPPVLEVVYKYGRKPQVMAETTGRAILQAWVRALADEQEKFLKDA